MNDPTQARPGTETVDSTWLAQLRREYLEYARQRDLLASAIFDAALKAGIINGEVPFLDGPQLLMVLDDLADCVVRSAAEVERFKTANAELSRLSEMRRNHLGNAKKAVGIGHGDDLVGAIEALRAAQGWITDHQPPDMHVVIMKFEGFWPGLGCGGIIDRYCYDGSWFNIPETITVTGWMYAPDNPPGTATDVDDIPDFSPGNGNKARRRAATLRIDMDASMKAGAIVPAPRPWKEVAEPVADADRRCHDPECWCCDGTGRDPSGNGICVYNGALPF